MPSGRVLVCAVLLLSASSARADEWRVDDGPEFVHLSPVDSRAGLEVATRLTKTRDHTFSVGEYMQLSVSKLVTLEGFGAGVYLRGDALHDVSLGTRMTGMEVGALGRHELREDLDLAVAAGVLAPFEYRPRPIVRPDAPPRTFVVPPPRLVLGATLVAERRGPGFRVGVTADLPLASWDRWHPTAHLQAGVGGRKRDLAFALELDVAYTPDAIDKVVPSFGATLQFHTRYAIPYVGVAAPPRTYVHRYTQLGAGVLVPL